MFNIMYEKDKIKPEFCPTMKICEAEEARKLVDFERLKKIVSPLNDDIKSTVNANYNGTALTVIGYMKPLNEKLYEDKYMSYIRIYLISAKNYQHIYIQHYPEKKYDIVIFLTKQDLDGNSIEDPIEQIKGCIKVDGFLKEELNDFKDPFTRRVRREFQEQLSVSSRQRMHLFSANFFPGDKKQEDKPVKKKRGRKKKSAD